MTIALVRIDDRLIHGQVVEGWLGAINADYILVINDKVSNDELQKALYSISVPTEIKVECLNIEEAAKKILDSTYTKNRLLILLASPEDALKLIRFGVKINSINVGGMHFSAGKMQISKAICVDEKDVDALKQIASLGIALEGRVLPSDEKIDVLKLISEKLSK